MELLHRESGFGGCAEAAVFDGGGCSWAWIIATQIRCWGEVYNIGSSASKDFSDARLS